MYSLSEPLSVTPLHMDIWIKFLTDSAIDDGSWVVEGLKHGFLLGISSASTISAKRNCPSDYEHPEIINNYLQEELRAGSMAGPIPAPPIQNFQINRFGVIPKSTPGKFRLITDLSFPKKGSVNNLISDNEATVSYAGIPEAIQLIMQLGKGCMLAKFDLCRAYRLLPVHPSLHRFFGMFWQGQF